MTGAVWVNGAFVARDDATVSAFDAGFQHGVGLFETLIARDGVLIEPARHVDRMRDSAKQLRLSESLRVPALIEAMQAVVDRAGLARCRVRLTVTGGDLNLLARGEHAPADPTVLIDARPATDYPAEMFDKGVAVSIADRRENPLDPFAGHKTLNYWPRLAELQKASARGAAEAVTLQVSNHLAGGCVSNIFLRRGDELLTPIARGEEEPAAVPSPVLPGITRRQVLDWAAGLDVNPATRMLSIDDLLDADEVFLTNSSWGVLPVVRVEAAPIAGGQPGTLARSLRELWNAPPRG